MKVRSFQVAALVIVIVTAAIVITSLIYSNIPNAEKIPQDSSSGGAGRLASVHVDRPRVRNLNPREGVYVYETAPTVIPYEGIVYWRWVYNLAKQADSKWSVTSTNQGYLIKPNRTVEFIPVISRIVVDVSGLAIYENYTAGNRTDVLNEELLPTTNDCILILVAPPWFIYLEPGEKVTINSVVTYLRPGGGVPAREDIGFPPPGQEIVREELTVGDEVIPCNSPTGKCFEVTSNLDMRFLEDDRLTHQRTNRYRFLVDAEYGIVVLLEEYIGQDVVMRISLVSWK